MHDITIYRLVYETVNGNGWVVNRQRVISDRVGSMFSRWQFKGLCYLRLFSDCCRGHIIPRKPCQYHVCWRPGCLRCHGIYTLRPRRNGLHFADDISKRIFFNENIWILIQISLKSVPKDPINNIPSLVQIMAWCRPGDKLLSEPMMVILLTHICVTRPQWVKGHVIDYIW